MRKQINPWPSLVTIVRFCKKNKIKEIILSSEVANRGGRKLVFINLCWNNGIKIIWV